MRRSRGKVIAVFKMDEVFREQSQRWEALAADPIAVLLDDLAKHGRASPEWHARVLSDGEEPLAVAWRRSVNSTAMVGLLELLDLDRALPLNVALVVVDPLSLTDHEAAELLRKYVPVPPTLAQIETVVQARVKDSEAKSCGRN